MKELYNSDWVVVKSQIHAGGRGKGTIEGTEQRGVALAKNHDKVKEIATNILAMCWLQANRPSRQTGEQSISCPGRLLPRRKPNEGIIFFYFVRQRHR